MTESTVTHDPLPEWRWQLATYLAKTAERLLKLSCRLYDDGGHWVAFCHTDPLRGES